MESTQDLLKQAVKTIDDAQNKEKALRDALDDFLSMFRGSGYYVEQIIPHFVAKDKKEKGEFGEIDDEIDAISDMEKSNRLFEATGGNGNGR